VQHATRNMHCLLHALSSDSSEQSGLSSHIQVSGTHSPGTARHVNSSGLHTFSSASNTTTVTITVLRTLRAVPLVRQVRAVGPSVARPRLRDTHTRRTLELTRPTWPRLCDSHTNRIDHAPAVFTLGTQLAGWPMDPGGTKSA
jgi:hypothetical protein